MDGEWVRDGDVARRDEGPTQERRETSCDVRWVGVCTLITAFVGKRGKEDDPVGCCFRAGCDIKQKESTNPL